jgi:hypothetical protein
MRPTAWALRFLLEASQHDQRVSRNYCLFKRGGVKDARLQSRVLETFHGRLCSRGPIARRNTGVLPDALIAGFDRAEEPAADCPAAARERLGDISWSCASSPMAAAMRPAADRVVEDAAEKVSSSSRPGKRSDRRLRVREEHPAQDPPAAAQGRSRARPARRRWWSSTPRAPRFARRAGPAGGKPSLDRGRDS